MKIVEPVVRQAEHHLDGAVLRAVGHSSRGALATSKPTSVVLIARSGGLSEIHIVSDLAFSMCSATVGCR